MNGTGQLVRHHRQAVARWSIAVTYYPKGHPKYKPDTRKGDRHSNKGDRHKIKKDRHLDKSDRHIITGDRHDNRSRKKSGFIMVDGEGYTTHRIVGYSPTKEPIYEQLYVLLVASSGPHDYIYNEEGLSTIECFNFLLKLSQDHPDKVLVCYMSTYDVEMMLRDVPVDALKSIWERRNNTPSRHPVHFTLSDGRNYAVSYLPRKQFYVRRQEVPPYKEVGRDEYGYPILEENYTSVTLYDIYDFFQCRFVDALGDSKRGYFANYIQEELIDGKYHEIIRFPDGSNIDLTQMKDMKNKRGSFTPEQREEIIAYCRDEVIAMQKLAEKLEEYLNKAGLLPFQSKWHGPGACTNKLLHDKGVLEHMHEAFPYPVSAARRVIDAQLMAYSAGRMELGKFGVYIGKVYHYDIHSAFPAVMPLLPSLTGGSWKHVRGLSDKPYSIVHVQWDFDPGLSFFPFFYRDEYGGIYYPPTGEGWYWKPEADAAIRAYNEGKLSTNNWEGKLNIIESWEFHPSNDTKPFVFLPELYNTRMKWKEEGNPAEKVLKFTINSIYGKLVQSRGWSLDKREYIVKPRYHNIGWSGYITSHVRAQMFDAVMQSPDDIVMILIDGLCSTKELKLPLGGGLGQWDSDEYDGIISVQSGIYFALKKLEREPTDRERQLEFFDSKFLYYNNEWYAVGSYYQGYNRGSITPKMVLDRWKDPNIDISPDTQSIMIPTRRFITSASAMSNDELLPYWRTWRTIDRKLKLLPTGKRLAKRQMVSLVKPYEELSSTWADTPHSSMLGKISHKYKPKWDIIEENRSDIDGVNGLDFDQEVMDSDV